MYNYFAHKKTQKLELIKKNVVRLLAGVSIPRKPMIHIAYSPYFQKISKFSSYFHEICKFPLFS